MTDDEYPLGCGLGDDAFYRADSTSLQLCAAFGPLDRKFRVITAKAREKIGFLTLDIRPQTSLPNTETDLAQLVTVVDRRRAFAERQSSGFTRPPARTAVDRAELQCREMRSECQRLSPSGHVQCRIELTLQPPFSVPIRAAMP